ncbi:MAG: hypothetical protein MK120_07415 [Puniceicoccaceae bacterium]|nr:hypothetical protein [Puniceicoccaceae bacterium]
MQNFMVFNDIGALSKGENSDRFRLGIINDRHVLIDPRGKPFYSLGINHINAVEEKASPNIFEEQFHYDWKAYSLSAVSDLERWNYNTAGYGSPEEIYPLMPYMEDSFLEKNSNFLPNDEFYYPDVFAPEVQSEKLRKIRTMCRHTDNPNLIGYYWTDTPQWDLQRSLHTRGTNWVIEIRKLPEDSPGRQRYEDYRSDCQRSNTLATDEGFLGIIAQEHYKLIGEATRQLHPNALIFGERYLLEDHPQVVLDAAMPYIDVISIQPGSDCFESDYFDDLYARYKKPIIICDHQCSFATPEYANTMWKQLDSEQAVANMYKNYLSEAVAKPYIIGYHRCQYIDRFNPHPGVLKQGLLREDGTAYEVLQKAVIAANLQAQDNFSRFTNCAR